MSANRWFHRQLERAPLEMQRKEYTDMGRLYTFMKRIGLKRVFTGLLGQPCHIADIYVGKAFLDERYVLPNGDVQDLKKMASALRAIIKDRRQRENRTRAVSAYNEQP